MDASSIERTLQRLIKDTQQLNSRTLTELHHTPSAGEFHHFVSANRPLILRGEGRRRGLAALDKWSDEYLIERMGSRVVDVAVSPFGNADSVVEHDGTEFFVEPATVSLTFAELFDKLAPPSEAPTASLSTAKPPKNRPVYYLQSQNGNLGGDLEPLVGDVGTDGPSWARDVFGASAEVANVWIGDSRSVTSLHKDPFENIYTVIRGSKTFILYPPTEFYCMHEQVYPCATYDFDVANSTFSLVPTTPPIHTPWIPLDPLNPSPSHTRHRFARPFTITLNAGDSLYLPALWYHHVRQTVGPGPKEGDRELAIAVNWWSEMDMGRLWPAAQLVRRLVLSLDGREEEEGLDSDSEAEEGEYVAQ